MVQNSLKRIPSCQRNAQHQSTPQEREETTGSVDARSSVFGIIAALALAAPPSLCAQDGLAGALSKAEATPRMLQSFSGPTLVVADFDNDHQPDGALLVNAGVIDGHRVFRVELHFSSAENRDLTLVSNCGSLAISAFDVNLDGMPDLIVEEALTHKRLQVWLNDGHGRFRQARVEDFPPQPDSPYKLQAPMAAQACLALSLPSRVETHQALLLRVLRFDSSSSHWKVQPGVLGASEFTSVANSSRAPPVAFPL